MTAEQAPRQDCKAVGQRPDSRTVYPLRESYIIPAVSGAYSMAGNIRNVYEWKEKG